MLNKKPKQDKSKENKIIEQIQCIYRVEKHIRFSGNISGHIILPDGAYVDVNHNYSTHNSPNDMIDFMLLHVTDAEQIDIYSCSGKLNSFPTFIKSYKSLRSLTLAFQDIYLIPPEIAALPKLRSLQISVEDKLPLLPKEFSGSNIKEMRLSSSKGGLLSQRSLTTISAIGLLQHLYIRGKIVNIDTLGQLQQGETLELYETGLPSIPPVIFELSKLTMLSLSGNTFDTLPELFDKLPHLTHLDLSENDNLAYLPSLEHNPKLESLNISNTSIDALPDWLRNISSLKYLRLEDTGITSLPLEKIKQLSSLAEIYVTANQLDSENYQEINNFNEDLLIIER